MKEVLISKNNGCLTLIKLEESKEVDEEFIAKTICLAYEFKNISLTFYRLDADLVILLKTYDSSVLEEIHRKVVDTFQS